MVSEVTIQPLAPLSGACVCVCISETRAFISPKTAEFLQLEGKSVGNTTDEKILMCVCTVHRNVWVCALHFSCSGSAVRG